MTISKEDMARIEFSLKEGIGACKSAAKIIAELGYPGTAKLFEEIADRISKSFEMLTK